MPAYRLDPVREKPQYAMVTVTGQADDVFVVEVVQLLNEEEARQATQSLTKLLRFAVDLHSTTLKRSAPWTVDDSPVKAKNARNWDVAQVDHQWRTCFNQYKLKNGDNILLWACFSGHLIHSCNHTT